MRYEFGGLLFGGAYFLNFTVAIELAVSFHLTEGTKACHWCVVRLRSIQLTTGKRAARTKRDFRFVLSLVKPVV